MPKWVEDKVSADLVNAATKVMQETDNKYQKLVRKCMKDMGIDDLSKATRDQKKKLFDKVDSMWNSDDEPGVDGPNTSGPGSNKDLEDKPGKQLDEMPKKCKKEDVDLSTIFSAEELEHLNSITNKGKQVDD